MASILDRILNRAPAPTTSTRNTAFASGNPLAQTGVDELEVYKALSTLYKVVAKRASSVAQVEWMLYQKPGRSRRAAELDDDRTPVDDHPALQVWNNPNPDTTATRFRKLWSLHLDLAGEAFIAPDKPNTPRELWQYRPDWMTPRATGDGLAGWDYKHPDTRRPIPFDTREIWAFIDPSPTDPYRGCSPIQALMTDIEANKAAAAWNRTFFINDCEIGGAIEAAEGLTDVEFDRLADQLNRNHRGVRNAHRWIIAEHGKVVPFTANHKDMQFEALRNLTRDLVREAYAMPKTLLGIGESVNRATAQAAWAIYLQQEILERLVELRRWLNNDYLPRFGNTARNLEFDFVDPVPMDHEQANAELTAKATAAVTLAQVWEPDQVLEVVGLPAMDTKAKPDPPPTPPPPPQLPAGPDEDVDEELPEEDQPEDRRRGLVARFRHSNATNFAQWVRNQEPDPEDLDPNDLPDVTGLQDSFDRTFKRLFDDWASIEDTQKAELVALVRQIIADGNLRQLENLAVNTGTATAALVDAMRELAEDGAEAVVAEAAEQDVEVAAVAPDEGVILEGATVVAGMIAGRLVASAKSTAMRHASPSATPDQVATAVGEALAELSVDGPRPQLTGALTGAQNDARLNTMKRAPSAALYANEMNDANTCGPCRAIDGKWLGNTEDIDQVRELYPGGAFGGYVNCEGRERCRGTVSAIWRPAQAS